MSLVVVLLTLATAVNGVLAGLNVDTALVKLPARRRIGAVAHATFARGNDLGNGLVVYPLFGVGAALLTVFATLLAFVSHAKVEVLLPLSIALLLSLPHSFATTRAAPIMLSLKHTPDDEVLLAAKLEHFARWHAVRATVQVATFFVLLWVLIIM